jgi:hypothetical protein
VIAPSPVMGNGSGCGLICQWSTVGRRCGPVSEPFLKTLMSTRTRATSGGRRLPPFQGRLNHLANTSRALLTNCTGSLTSCRRGRKRSSLPHQIFSLVSSASFRSPPVTPNTKTSAPENDVGYFFAKKSTICVSVAPASKSSATLPFV